MRALMCGLALLLAAAPAAQAANAGFSLVIDDLGEFDLNVPRYTLTNISDAGIALTSLRITIGDPTYTWDYVLNIIPGGTGVSFSSPDTTDGFGSSDVAMATFSGFDPQESVIFELDVDLDTNLGFIADYRMVLFGNGAAVPNSIVSVGFSTGQELVLTLPEDPTATMGNRYQFAQAVPLPAAAWLTGLGLLGVSGLRRRTGS